MKKICGTCKVKKDTTEFNKKGNGHQSYCKTCQKIYKDKHYQNNKRYYKDKQRNRKADLIEWVQSIKKTLKCEKCGEDRWYVLDFHHKDPKTKELPISESARNGWSKDRILKEIKKCSVLCSNCHREYHFLELE